MRHYFFRPLKSGKFVAGVVFESGHEETLGEFADLDAVNAAVSAYRIAERVR